MPGNEVPANESDVPANKNTAQVKEIDFNKPPAKWLEELKESFERTGYKPLPINLLPPIKRLIPELPDFAPAKKRAVIFFPPPPLPNEQVVSYFAQSKSILPPLPKQLGPHPNEIQNYHGTKLQGLNEVLSAPIPIGNLRAALPPR